MAAAGATAAAVGEQLADVGDLVRRICVSRLGAEDGADAAQEVMLRLWRAVQRPEFRVEGLHRYAAAAVAALAQVLSSRQRTVLGVSMATDWDTDAVAARLGLSQSGVRSSQVRTMAQLRAAAGVGSRNPLASPLSERARRRRLRAAAHAPAPLAGAGRQEVLDVAA